MAVHTLKLSREVNYTGAGGVVEGVTFSLNPNGGGIQVVTDPDFNQPIDTGFWVNDTGTSTIAGGQLTMNAYTAVTTVPSIPLVIGNEYEITIDVDTWTANFTVNILNQNAVTVTSAGITTILFTPLSGTLNEVNISNINATQQVINSLHVTDLSAGGGGEIVTATHIPTQTFPSDIITYEVPWTVDPDIGDVVEFDYDLVVGKYEDHNIFGDDLGLGTVALTGGVWVQDPPGTFTHDATTVGGGIRTNNNNGLYIENTDYLVTLTSSKAGDIAITGGGSIAVDVNGVGKLSAIIPFGDPLVSDNIQIFSSIPDLVISDITIQKTGVPIESQTVALVNCADYVNGLLYRFGSIYSGTKDVLTTWITEKQATGVNALWVKNGTVDVNIGWGDTEAEASVTKQTVIAGDSVLIEVTGTYIGWQGTVGTVDIEQSVAR